MKKTLLTSIFILLASIFMFSCGGDDPAPELKTPEQIAVERLANDGSATWSLENGGSVTKDGVAQTASFTGFEITFNAANENRTYSTVNSNNIFDPSGNWSITGNNLDRVILTGNQPAAGQEIQVTRNADNLRLNFTIPMPPAARTTAVAGTYVMELTKK
ncbi:MAG TPA: hypothetical protein VK921_04290 [Anditalea sp.]|nr:hypothetical protein [Anditalea sp.]